jgi:hypothetical protein
MSGCGSDDGWRRRLKGNSLSACGKASGGGNLDSQQKHAAGPEPVAQFSLTGHLVLYFCFAKAEKEFHL